MTMKVLNYGSLNIDYVYSVDHIFRKGETIPSNKLETVPGGKGLNQSIALAKAGIPVFQAGMIGQEGDFLQDYCQSVGVNTDFVKKADVHNGHAIIQVDKYGQNSILLFGGSNRALTIDSISYVLSNFEAGDMILLQNEINLLDLIIDMAYERGLIIVMNPSPYDNNLQKCDFSKVSWFMLNEIEAAQMTGETDTNLQPDALLAKYSSARFVLTLGAKGSCYTDAQIRYWQPCYHVKAVDTTAAGDTFTGFFLAAILKGKPINEALDLASKAAAIAVTKKGASCSIPTLEEVLAFSFG